MILRTGRAEFHSAFRSGGEEGSLPDVPVKTAILTHLRDNRYAAAARAAFTDYDDDVLGRYFMLSSLGERKLRTLIESAIPADLSAALRDFTNPSLNANRAIGFHFARAFSSSYRAVEIYKELILAGDDSDYAARKLIFLGSRTKPEEYRKIYKQLRAELPESNRRNDWHEFLARDGVIINHTRPVGERQALLDQWAKVFRNKRETDERRAEAAVILGRWGATEYFDALYHEAQERPVRPTELDRAIAGAIANIFGFLRYTPTIVGSPWLISSLSQKETELGVTAYKLMAHLIDNHKEDCALLISKLAEIEHPDRMDLLLEIIDGRSRTADDTRRQAEHRDNVLSAIYTLGNIGDERAIPSLISIIEDV